MSCVTDVGPTDIDIVITTNGAKRKTKGSRNYLGRVKKRYEKYIKIKEKFSPKKRQIAEDIVKALRPGRFMKKDNGQWKVLSTEDAVNRVMQRFCDERAYRARKAKSAETTKKAEVSKVDTTPSTPKGEPTIARQHVITPTSDNEKSFEPIELTGSPTSVAVPIYLTTPVVDVEKDLTSSDTLLATEGGVGDWPDDELLILRDLYPYNGE